MSAVELLSYFPIIFSILCFLFKGHSQNRVTCVPANEDRCAEIGTMVSQDIEHDIGSGSSGGGQHKGGEISTMPSQVTEAIPSGLGEMIPSLGQFSGSGPLP